MIATVTALLECRPVRGRSIVVALGVALDAGILSLMVLAGGHAAQAAAVPAVQSAALIAAPEFHATQKADRLVKPVHLAGGCAAARNTVPARCLHGTA